MSKITARVRLSKLVKHGHTLSQIVEWHRLMWYVQEDGDGGNRHQRKNTIQRRAQKVRKLARLSQRINDGIAEWLK